MKPHARDDDSLLVQDLEGETLVYDLERDRAHCLNGTAARVWRYCDGRTSVKRMAGRLARDIGQPVDESVVWVALKQLDKARLLRERLMTPAGIPTSRRAALRRLGLAAAFAPVVLSLMVPEAVEGASCASATGRPNGCPCTNGGQCASRRCGGSPKRCF